MQYRLAHIRTTLFVKNNRVMRKNNPFLQKDYTKSFIIKRCSSYRIAASGNYNLCPPDLQERHLAAK